MALLTIHILSGLNNKISSVVDALGVNCTTILGKNFKNRRGKMTIKVGKF